MLLAVERFTRFTRGTALIQKSAAEVARFFVSLANNNIRFEVFHSDNGKEFVNFEMNSLVESLNSSYIHGMPYKPRVQGLVESRILKENFALY